MSLVELIDFDIKGDDRGSLVSLEENKNIPFDIKRVYYIFGTHPGVERGFHAHHKLRQVLICLNGECTVVLDDGIKKEELTLSTNTEGLLIEPYIWHEMKNFSAGAILVSIASDFYKEVDYIRNYGDFLKAVKK